MKCVKCGAELREGCIYCSACGHEVQILPDYSVLEDDYLRSLLTTEEKKKAAVSSSKQQQPQSQPKTKQKNPKMPLIITICFLAVAILIGISVKLSIDHKNANSYDYQVEMAKKELVDLNYEKALNYYDTALTIQPGDVSVRLAMADIYIGQKDYDSAAVLLIEVLGLDKNRKEAYEKLIDLYEKKEDYNSIVALADGVTNTSILELFEGYIVSEPVVSEDAGSYDDIVTITLFSVDEDDIYYTLNGKTPDAENGILYDADEPIKLEKNGTYQLQAVSRNENGIYSPLVKAVYTIELAPPEYPTVTPDGGRMSEETQVTIEAEENCSIYYTWDETNPTVSSEKYQEPLAIPEGNNVLSILVVDDETGLNSGVYRTNFIYYP